LNIPATRIIRAVEPRHALVAVPDYQRSDVSKIAKMGKTQQTEKISHRIPDFEACINLRLNLLTTLPLSP
jgi:hypothetical protein